jgi:hypothetical protein
VLAAHVTAEADALVDLTQCLNMFAIRKLGERLPRYQNCPGLRQGPPSTSASTRRQRHWSRCLAVKGNDVFMEAC